MKRVLLSLVASTTLAVTACTGTSPPPAQSAVGTTSAPASIQPVPLKSSLPGLKGPPTGAEALRASQVVGRLQAQNPDAWGGQYARGQYLVVLTALTDQQARQDLTDAGLADAPIKLRHSPITLTRLEEAADRALDAVAATNLTGTTVGPQYGSRAGPRIVVGIPADDLPLRLELARIQQETGVPVITYLNNRVSGN